jgi:transcriptional regulator with XRE-family HTH domain
MNTTERRELLRTFLTERRSKLQPADVGLPMTLRRRVPGLRREEVAELVGVTPNWYAFFEAGSSDRRFSPAFVQRVADALLLGEQDRITLFRLALPEVAAASEHFEKSSRDGALHGIARVRDFSRRLLTISSFEEGVLAAAETLEHLVNPTRDSVAISLQPSGVLVSVAVGTAGYTHPALAYQVFECNSPGRFGVTVFNENRPNRRSTEGAQVFQHQLADGRSFKMSVDPTTPSLAERNFVPPKPTLENGLRLELRDSSVNSEDFWSWNEPLQAQAALLQGLFDRGVYKGVLVGFWSDPHTMKPAEVEVIQTLAALLELAAGRSGT